MRRTPFLVFGTIALLASLPGCSAKQDATPTPGGCPTGTTSCDGTCRDLTSDSTNCGTCGTACPGGSACVQGACSCTSGFSACPSGCVALASDPLNCGSCDNACTAGQVCSNGVCGTSCGAGLAPCGQSCVDLATNPLNCGSCGFSCNAGLACVNGACGCGTATACGAECVDTMVNPLHCGGCNIPCGSGQSCVAGACIAGGTGGAGTGGAPTGGTATGGSGAATGGAVPTGGANTGGTATGGSATGGVGAGGTATGGAATGGVGAGGSGGTGGGTTTCSSAFTSSAAATAFAAEYENWKSCWVKSAANGTFAVINSGTCNSSETWVVSEGIGYGMLAAVGAGDQPLFDGLWQFYLDHADATRGLMNWSVDSTDPPGDNDSNAASDGDLDAAMALFQAEAKWGGYLSDALTLIDNIRVYETDVCNGMTILKPGDVWGGCSGDGSGNGNGQMNPSYFAPGYYRVFAQYDTANAAHWNQLADDSYTLLAAYQTQMNGLVPEWSYLDGNIENNYGYNACRTPWRVATDYAWFCTPAAKTFLDNVVTYIDGNGGIAGVPFDKNSAFLGGFAVSGVAHSQEKLDAYVPAWLSTAQSQDTAYFQSSLRVVYLMLAGGSFPSTL